MRNITRITTQDELTREIADTELDIDRQRLSIKNGWHALKEDMRPANLVRGLFSRPSNSLTGSTALSKNGISSGLPMMAAKVAAGFLVNRWMAKKSLGATKLAAGMLLQSGLVALISKWTSRKLQKNIIPEKQTRDERLETR